MATRFSRRLYSYRGTRRSGRAYRFPKRYSNAYRGARRYGGYGAYGSALARIAPLAIRAAPYIYKGYRAYRRGGFAGVKSYAGKVATSAAKSAIKAVTGYGAYKGVGRGGMTGTQAPSIRNGSLDGGTIVISHKEFLGDIHSSPIGTGKAFYGQTFRLNPGDETTFPWLSQISKNFQQYRLEGLCFHYKSMSADALNSTNTALGTVIMCTQYDATQTPPTSKEEMENMEFTQSVKPSQSMTHFIECAKSQSPLDQLYINAEPGQQSGDRRFYDFGLFTIATQGMQHADVNLGELWVSYQIRLYKPQLWDAIGNDVLSFHYGSDGYPVDGCDATHPLGNKDWTKPKDNPTYYDPKNNLEVFSKTANAVSFHPTNVPKTFMVQFLYYGTTAGGADVVNAVEWLNCDENTNSILATNGIYDGSIQGPTADEETNGLITLFTINVEGQNLGRPWGLEVALDKLSLPGNITRFKFNVIEVPYKKWVGPS